MNQVYPSDIIEVDPVELRREQRSKMALQILCAMIASGRYFGAESNLIGPSLDVAEDFISKAGYHS